MEQVKKYAARFLEGSSLTTIGVFLRKPLARGYTQCQGKRKQRPSQNIHARPRLIGSFCAGDRTVSIATDLLLLSLLRLMKFTGFPTGSQPSVASAGHKFLFLLSS